MEAQKRLRSAINSWLMEGNRNFNGVFLLGYIADRDLLEGCLKEWHSKVTLTSSTYLPLRNHRTRGGLKSSTASTTMTFNPVGLGFNDNRIAQCPRP
jgi:hypothetical protein